VQKAIGLPGTLNVADSSCIAVSAPHVTLFLGGLAITDTPFSTGIGIHFTASAKNSFLAGGGSVISQWTTGIEDEASNVTIANVETDNNTGTGILVQNASGVTVDHFGSHANGSYGVQLNGISHSEISDGIVDAMDTDPLGTNLVAGIALGPSSGVKIFGNCVMGNNGVGIELQGGASNSKVTGNEVTSNMGGNLTDMNNNCGSNLWFGNEYDMGTGNPATCTGSHVTTGLCPTPTP
jgi:parallel beta-helix repeat protein